MTTHDWIDLTKGPLFAFTFLVMILGLLRHVIIQVFSLVSGKGRRLRSGAAAVPQNGGPSKRKMAMLKALAGET